MIEIEKDYFDLFGLQAKFSIDVESLHNSWVSLASLMHPDHYANADLAERSSSTTYMSYINDAYHSLKDPLSRAVYLCERAGISFGRNNNKLDKNFLLQQMEWYELLDCYYYDEDQLNRLFCKLNKKMDEIQDSISELLDHMQDYSSASKKVREWMFWKKFMKELKSAQMKLKLR